LDNARRHMGNPEFQREALAVIERTVVSLRELMGQVSSVARAPDLTRDDASLASLVEEALSAAGLRRGAHDGLVVHVKVPDLVVSVDRRHMVRVLTNLLVNARESLPGGHGEINVAADAPSNGGSGEVSLEVSDSGRGMTEDFVRGMLFRPFATTKPGGLGIGLAQVKSIVEAHGGSIVVASRPGEGSTFTLRIPGATTGVVAETPP
jgi:signal transduction histidine kinase